MRKEVVLVVDVETCGGFGSPKVYDLGIAAVVRSTGEILETASLVIEDVFFGRSREMETAYYADKIPYYHDGIRNGAFRVVSAWKAWRGVRGMIADYNIRRVYAYNAAFDKNALNNTMKVVTKGTCRNFFPKNMVFCDIWHMACQTVLRQTRFRKWASTNGHISEAGNYRTSAEVAYAYIINDPEFVESHTGLDDAIIESAILRHVLRQKKKVDESIVHNPWRLAQVST